MAQKRTNQEMEILAYLYNNDTHIRGIEKAIKIPHATVLRKLAELEKNNIIDFKLIGKNKQYFIKKNLKARKMLETVENYKVLRLFQKYPNLEPLFEEIMEKCNSKLIILFGSYAKDIPKIKSDIDIYIETQNEDMKKKAEEINSKLSIKIGKFDKDSLLIKEIIRNHIIIKGVERFYEQVFN